MSARGLEIISVFVNLALSVGKFLIGLSIASVSLIAEGIHSLLDVFSSLIAFLGIREAGKGKNEKYPYGRYRFEPLAAFVVVLMLASSAIWILYEAVKGLAEPEIVTFSLTGIFIMAGSVVLNEIMARLKFKVGGQQESLALVADAEHDRADVIASLGVFIGLFLIPYWPLADSIIAILVGLYIIYEAIQLGRETIDALVDVANPDLERKITKIAQKLNITISKLKSRKIGSASFAEVEIELSPDLKLDQATRVAKSIEQELLKEIPELKQVIVSAQSHNISRSVIRPGFGLSQIRGRGRGMSKQKLEQIIGFSKKGFRVISPMNTFDFGAKKYLVKDFDKNNKLIQKKEVTNPYYNKEQGSRGVRFIRDIQADKVIANNIGENAQANLTASGIEFEIKKPSIK